MKYLSLTLFLFLAAPLSAQTTRDSLPVNAPPAASLSVFCAKLVCWADGSWSVDDKRVYAYNWRWGDSTTVTTGETSKHQYTTPGTYLVTLTVWDREGLRSSASKSVTLPDSGATR